MNIAAVINVAGGAAGLSQATQTQTLLLEHLGSQLGSVRLAVPRLLKFACRGAVAENPDLLVIAGGPRAARRAAQIAYAHRMPILFLPGRRAPQWTGQLWGSLSLEDMTRALAHGDLAPVSVPVGVANGQIFFGNAVCAFVPQISQFRADLTEAETLSAATRVLEGAAFACSLAFGRTVRMSCDDARRRASAIVVSTTRAGGSAPDASLAPLGSFACAAWNQGAVALVRASWRAAAGGDWQSVQEPERFSCSKLTLHSGRTIWLLLDGDAIAFNGVVELRYLPNAVETFTFASGADYSHAPARNRFRVAQNKPWEPGHTLHVRI